MYYGIMIPASKMASNDPYLLPFTSSVIPFQTVPELICIPIEHRGDERSLLTLGYKRDHSFNFALFLSLLSCVTHSGGNQVPCCEQSYRQSHVLKYESLLTTATQERLEIL